MLHGRNRKPSKRSGRSAKTHLRRGQSGSVARFESLEHRRLLSTYVYNVPSGTTAVYLKPKTNGPAGAVEVHLDSPNNPAVFPNPFDNANGQDIIDCGSITGFKFVNMVPAAKTPQSDGNDAGIKFRGGSNGTLEIDAGPTDQLIEMGPSTADGLGVIRAARAPKTRLGNALD